MRTIGSLRLYAIFHLNIMYSSIEEEQREEVIKKCYWPLLNLARLNHLPLGIEASAFTLEIIASIDPAWVAELSMLTREGPCVFIGSGYAQLIGPLVPAEVNSQNLKLGNESYEKLLGFRPGIALVNEQAYSSGLLQHYLDAGYRAIIMEWDNPASQHGEWDINWRYLPQYACDQHGNRIALLWNYSIGFQKFQRYVHGDMEIEEYMIFLGSQAGNKMRAFPLYGNDVEIFDFRPGRYTTEAMQHEEGEWKRINRLFKALLEDDRFDFISPDQVTKLISLEGAGNYLHLETPQQPVPVKKQEKYNITRWAVTGRDDIGINTACRQIYNALIDNVAANKDDWRELCYLWSSDFRTHITEKRWNEYLERLGALKLKADSLPEKHKPDVNKPIEQRCVKKDEVKLQQKDHILSLESEGLKLKLNCRRGLAIESLWFVNKEGPPLLGTLAQGFYPDIKYGVDWYSGHLVLEPLGQPKVTDLEPVKPEIESDDQKIKISGKIASPLGNINKLIEMCPAESRITLSYNLDWNNIPPGSFRLGFVTLNPLRFDRYSLYYETCNGGFKPERFNLAKSRVDHGSAVSFLVSANSGLGLTDGWVKLGDRKSCIRINVDRDAAALIGLVTYHEIGNSYFCRLFFSAGEVDDTRKVCQGLQSELSYSLSITLA